MEKEGNEGARILKNLIAVPLLEVGTDEGLRWESIFFLSSLYFL